MACMPRRVQTGVRLPNILWPREAVAAVDPLGLGRRQQRRQVVADLAVAGREHLAGRSLLAAASRATGRPCGTGRRRRPIQYRCMLTASAVAGAR